MAYKYSIGFFPFNSDLSSSLGQLQWMCAFAAHWARALSGHSKLVFIYNEKKIFIIKSVLFYYFHKCLGFCISKSLKSYGIVNNI